MNLEYIKQTIECVIVCYVWKMVTYNVFPMIHSIVVWKFVLGRIFVETLKCKSAYADNNQLTSQGFYVLTSMKQMKSAT